tara:strand:- start:363 stop:674 length:312 start_codon:yes stop_codon:yes gene_type:complete
MDIEHVKLKFAYDTISIMESKINGLQSEIRDQNSNLFLADEQNKSLQAENKALKEHLYSCLRWFKMRRIYKAWVLKNDKGLEILKPIILLLDLQTPTEPKGEG